MVAYGKCKCGLTSYMCRLTVVDTEVTLTVGYQLGHYMNVDSC